MFQSHRTPRTSRKHHRPGSDSHVAAFAMLAYTVETGFFKSDVSMTETEPSDYGSPAANLQGRRRGLLAHRIISTRSNSDGSSPLITIQVISPAGIEVPEFETG